MFDIKNKPEKKSTGVYLDKELHQKIVEIAERHNISINSAINQLLVSAVELYGVPSNAGK